MSCFKESTNTPIISVAEHRLALLQPSFMTSSSKRKFTPKKRTAISGGAKSDSSNGLTRNGSSYAQRVVKELCHRCRDIFITEVFCELAKNLALRAHSNARLTTNMNVFRDANETFTG